MSNTVVRTNVLSLNAHRNLGLVGSQQSKASARLSSGYRINSAADDAAGLGISEKMRAQIRGLDQASRNGQDGISLIQTAEGAMSTINEMVVRIRELVVQAANDTNAHEDDNHAQSDRVRIQDEINQLMDEIDATRNRTQFNTRQLIDGSLGSGPVTNSSRPAASGAIKGSDLFSGMTNEEIWTQFETFMASSAGGNIINGWLGVGSQDSGMDAAAVQKWLDELGLEVIGGISVDAVVNQLASFFQETIANVIGFTGFQNINSNSTQQEIDDNMTAWADAVGKWMGGMDAINGSASSTGNGYMAENLKDLFGISSADMTAGQRNAANAIVNALKASDLSEFFKAPEKLDDALAFDGNSVDFDAWNVRPANQGAAQNAVSAFIIEFAAKNMGLLSGGNSPWPGSSNVEANLQNLLNWFNASGQVTGGTVDDLEGLLEAFKNNGTSGLRFEAGQAKDLAGELLSGIQNIIKSFEGAGAGSGGSGNALWFQIGANRDQGVHLSIEDVGTAALSNIGVNGQKAHEIADGFSFADLRTSSSQSGIQTGNGVMLAKGEDIQQFITAIDEALAHVTGQRSLLGAMQNRLEFTIENLDIASENLSSAESRIRDADMAKEMMSLTQANVLQQAAISMLAQANQAPQSVLQLLG